jgi:Putative Actinobacterial Holin-X, holin superfamily III
MTVPPAPAPRESSSVVSAAREGYQTARPAMESEDGRSIGQILGDVSRDVSTLMRQEVALAKAEARQSATRAGKGIGLFAGAGVAGMLFLVFISVCVWWALGGLIGRGWSALIVAVIWAIIAVILVVAGRAEMKRIRGLPQTAETMGKVPNALKGQEEENR